RPAPSRRGWRPGPAPWCWHATRCWTSMVRCAASRPRPPRRPPGGRDTGAGALVLACDSVLDIDGQVRGKPSSPAEATAWWQGYRGRTGTLVTGHALVEVRPDGRWAEGVAATTGRFGDPGDAE